MSLALLYKLKGPADRMILGDNPEARSKAMNTLHQMIMDEIDTQERRFVGEVVNKFVLNTDIAIISQKDREILIDTITDALHEFSREITR